MVPVPPGEFRQAGRDIFRKPAPDDPRRISGDDGVGRNVLGHDRACRDDGAGADIAARQDHGAVPDPDVMADVDVMAAAPCEKLRIVAFLRKIRAGAIGEMRLRSPLHGVIARIDPRHRGDRAEFPDRRVGDLRVVHDVGIVVHRHFMQDRARADLAIGAEPGVVQFRGWIDGRFDREHFAGHANSRERNRAVEGSGRHRLA